MNGKQVVVTFNNALDAKTVTKSAFTVTQTDDAAGRDRLTNTINSTNNVTGATVDTGSVKLSEDKKSVTITVDNGAAFDNPTAVTVVAAETLKDEAGTALVKTTKTAELKDSSVPTVTAIESAGTRQIRVIFSEPVTTGADTTDTGLTGDLAATASFVIDNFAYAVQDVARDEQNPNALLITTSGDIAAGEHTLKVNPTTPVPATNPIVDYAGFALVTTDVKFTQVTDVNAPTFTARSIGEHTVELTFNRSVTIPNSANIELRASYDATGAAKVNATGFTPVTGSNGTKYIATFAEPLTPGPIQLFLSYANTTALTDANTIFDSYGNRLATGTSTTVNVVADTVAPSITKVENKSITTLEVTFSEVVANATVPANFKLTNDKGEEFAITNSAVKADTNGLTYVLTTASLANGGNFTLTANDQIHDISVAENKLTNAAFNFAVADLLAPTIANNAVTINTNRDKIYVEYSEPVAITGANSGVDAGNYRFLDGGVYTALPSGSTLKLNGNVVVITLPAPLATTPQLAIGQIADVAGNKTEALETARAIGVLTGWTVTTASKDVTVLDRETVQFKVNRQLSSISATDISLTGATAATSATFINNADGSSTVTAKFAKDTIATDLTNITGVAFAAGAFTDTNAIASAVLPTVAKVAAWDKVKPEYIASNPVTIEDKDNNGFLDTVTIEFTEALYAPSVQDSDFTVEGYTIASVDTTTANKVVITLKERTTTDLTATPTVTLTGSVEDSLRNAVGPIAGVKAVYLAPVAPVAPVAGDVTITAGATDKVSISIATTLEYRVTDSTGVTEKQGWTTGTGAAVDTTTNVVVGDKIEVRVKAAGSVPASAVYTHTVVAGEIGL